MLGRANKSAPLNWPFCENWILNGVLCWCGDFRSANVSVLCERATKENIKCQTSNSFVTHIWLNFVRSFVVYLSRFLSALLAFISPSLSLFCQSWNFYHLTLSPNKTSRFSWQQGSRILVLIEFRDVRLDLSTWDMSSEITRFEISLVLYGTNSMLNLQKFTKRRHKFFYSIVFQHSSCLHVGCFESLCFLFAKFQRI